MSGVTVWERVRRVAGHEGRWLVSLGWWVARRRIGVGAGDRPFGYGAAQAAIVYGLTFVCAVETAALVVLLVDHPVAHLVMLVINVYTVLTMLGLQAAAVTRPHVLGADSLRLRDGARMEVDIPLERIASVRYDLRFTKAGKQQKGAGRDGLLELAVAGQTSVTLALREPVMAVRLLGRRTEVRTVRFHADDARGAVAAVRAAVAAVAAAAAATASESSGAAAGAEDREAVEGAGR